jgi:hypothetical protein
MDKLIAFIKNMTGNQLLFYLFLMAGGACPGLLVIWRFKPSMIDHSTVPMLLALSVAITLPFICINTLFSIYAIFQSHLAKDISEVAPHYVACGAFVTMLVISLPVLASFIWVLSFKEFILSAFAIETLFLFFCGCSGLIMYKPKNRKFDDHDSDT